MGVFAIVGLCPFLNCANELLLFRLFACLWIPKKGSNVSCAEHAVVVDEPRYFAAALSFSQVDRPVNLQTHAVDHTDVLTVTLYNKTRSRETVPLLRPLSRPLNGSVVMIKQQPTEVSESVQIWTGPQETRTLEGAVWRVEQSCKTRTSHIEGCLP